MKNFFYVVCISLLLSSLSACNTAPSLEEQAKEKLNEVLASHNAVGLSVAVVKDGKVIYTQAVGYSNLEDSTLLNTDNLFRIASISKSFTATAIMQLHEAGEFNLDDDVSIALGVPVKNPKYPDTFITYRMLLSHTSSLSDKNGYFTFDAVDPEKNENYANAYNDYIPGSKYEYCNLGFNMLGALVEIHSGERFDEYIKAHIIDPLKLNAGYNVNMLDVGLFARIYDLEDGKYTWQPEAYAPRKEQIENGYVMGRTTPIFSPTGGMKIAPKDLAKHMLVQIGGGTFDGAKILSLESVTAMQTPYQYEGQNLEDDYGFALRVTDKLIKGEVLVGHTGSAYGLYSAMFFEPQKKFGIIMMTNGSPAQRGENGFLTIQSDAINALYDVFIREVK
ncbi:MAG: beta-lactamase family protein [Prevotellaceae bacterium]|jgi:CubicO group peptidase (beta-lactamase class C family)|nr:beta-lactamase family protein [Prevotellaceae bacterium]